MAFVRNLLRNAASSWSSLGRLVGVALALGAVMAVQLAAGNGFLPSLMSGTLPWPSLLLVATMVAASTAAMMIAFTMTLKPDPIRMAAALASAALAMTSGLEASQALNKLPLHFYYSVTMIGEVALTYGAALVWMRSIKVTGKWATQPPLWAAGAVAAVGAGGLIGQSFLSLDAVGLNLALARDGALFLMAVSVLLLFAAYKPLRLDKKSWRESVRLRLPPRGEDAGDYRAFQILSLGFAGAVIFQIFVRGLDLETLRPLTVASLAWLGIAAQGIGELASLSTEQRQGHMTARMATSSARKFLRRHMSDGTQWAATVGIKTSTFVIDHDPESELHAQLPASIMQIRADEIGRCVVDVLGAMNLHSHSVGHRLTGAVDPEASLRPCVDALKLFAALYLDAGPLVERRIKGLTSLLPIVDPGLAKMLQAKDVNALIRRNLWFFHIDFGWLDQHVVHTPKLTRYDVRMTGLSSRMRHAMMDHLERTGGVGNFVWIGPDARERLVQEAPALSNIIEACPIATGDGDELLMFIIKFEQLIPRLQRYYDLDSMRRSLKDFEPSQEAARVHALLKLQIAKARNTAEMTEALTAIASIPWRGFREKDNALQLVLAVYNQAQATFGTIEMLGAAKDAKLRLLHEKLFEAVKAVGYPSQVLHNAQIDKLQLRDVRKLLAAASDRQSPRFEEAWLLLATTDFVRYPLEQRAEMHGFLVSVARRSALAPVRLVQTKSVDALAALARAVPLGEDGKKEADLLGRSLDALGTWFATVRADPDICCLLLDTKLFLSSQLGLVQVDFGPDALAALETAFKELAAEHGASNPKIAALMSRWQEYRTHMVQAA